MALFDDKFAPYVPFGSRTLSSGASGTDVAVVQSVYNLMLVSMNPPNGPMGQSISITGTFDSSTVTAVKNIQSYFGITADGVVGSATYFLYGQGVGANTTYGGPVYGSRQLSMGNSGGDVTILQNRLNCFRYASMIGAPATGTFNSQTADAVRAFKADAEQNGDTGFPDNAIAGFGFYDATWIYTFAGGRAIYTGRNGFDVVFLQTILKDLGYYRFRITGYYDAATRDAVMDFQRAQGISVDGVVGPVTFYRIGLSNAEAAPKPLDIAWPVKVTPKVSVCCVALTTETSDLHPYGQVAHVINEEEGFESLDVVANFLPRASSYGNYNQYGFAFYDATTDTKLGSEPMVRVSETIDPGDWAGTHSPGVKSIPSVKVIVYPMNSSTGRTGNVVLAGNTKDCH